MTTTARGDRIYKNRININYFDSLIASPVSGAVTLPANGRFALTSTAGCAAGTTAATVVSATNRTIKTPLLAAGQRFVIDRLEKGSVVTPQAGFELCLLERLDRSHKIAAG